MANWRVKSGSSDRFFFSPWALKWLLEVTIAIKLKMLATWKERYDKPREHINKQRYHFADKSPYCQSYGFASCHVQIWDLNHKEDWVLKNWSFWTVVLETVENPLDWKETKGVNPKGIQSWIFIGRTDAETKAPVLWPLDVKSWLLGKDPAAGKDWRQKERAAEDEMVR